MAIRQKGGAWQVDVTVKGIRAPRVSCATEAEAKRVEADFRLKLMAGVPAETLNVPLTGTKKARVGSLGQLVDATQQARWTRTKGEETAVRNATAWADILGEEFPVADLTPAVVSDVCSGWAAKGNAPATINRKIAALNVMMGVALDREWIDKVFKMPWRKEYEGRLRYYDDAELASLLDMATRTDPQMGSMFMVAVDTGLRLGNLQKLQCRDVDLTQYRVDVGITKGGKRHSVPLTNRARFCLNTLCKGKAGHELVFPDYLTSRHMGRLIERWRIEQGLPDHDKPCFHTFRHTCCSRLMMAGVPIHVVKEFMNHAVIETTMRYAHLAPKSLEMARDALEGWGKEPTT